MFFSWVEISWCKRMDPLPLPFNCQLLLVLISWPPTGQISCWLGHTEVGWQGKSAHCLPYQCHCQTEGTSASPTHAISWFLSSPILFGSAFPLCYFTDADALAPALSCTEVWALLYVFLPPTCYQGNHLLSASPSFNGNLPSNVHLQPSCQNTQRRWSARIRGKPSAVNELSSKEKPSAEWNKSKKDKYCRISLTCEIKIKIKITKKKTTRFIDTKNRLVVARGQWVKEFKMYKFPDIKKMSWGCNV